MLHNIQDLNSTLFNPKPIAEEVYSRVSSIFHWNSIIMYR